MEPLIKDLPFFNATAQRFIGRFAAHRRDILFGTGKY